MEKKFKIMMSLFVIALGIVWMSGCSKKEDTVEEPKVTMDMLNFKEEYEDYNGRDNGHGSSYQLMNLPELNLVKYSSINEILALRESGTGVIVFGFPTCPWCRGAFPVLIEAGLEAGLTNLYYINMTDVRTTWEVQDGEAVKIGEGKEGYYDLLEAFDTELEPYYLTDSDTGAQFDTGEKRILVPLVVFVKDGEIIGSHLGSVDLNEGQTAYSPLTDDQVAALKKIYLDYILELGDGACTKTC